MLLPPVVPGVPPGPQHHPTLPAGRGVTPRVPRHLCRHRNVVQSSNFSHHTHFRASLPLTSTPTVTCTTGTSPQNLHVFRQERCEDQCANSRAAAKSSSRRKAYEGSSGKGTLDDSREWGESSEGPEKGGQILKKDKIDCHNTLKE